MLKLFKRAARPSAPDLGGLGATLVAQALPAGCAVPPGCCAVVVDADGRTRRVSEGGRLRISEPERALCFHPGPYGAELVPFVSAPEIGLRVSFAVDSPDPRLVQQRFDLYLASECGVRLELSAFAAAMEDALQRELAQGNLELPPCTSLDEWNAFRAGFNQLLYTRFGVSVDDCMPIDLGASRDYGQILLARIEGAAPEAPLPQQSTVEPFDAAASDARSLRRLFLELPCLMSGLRAATLPASPALFRQRQELLQRLDLVTLSASTMPALELAAPAEALPVAAQVRRARHSSRAAAELDEAWALLARIELAGDGTPAGLLDEFDRIVANLESQCAGRRALHAREEEA
jgi:hypothetical protein